jgi:diguanylate cyclase (GGDEF)-like protein
MNRDFGSGHPRWALLWVLLGCVPLHAQVAATPDIDRAEELSWSDSTAALKLLDKLKPTADSGPELVRWLMVRGLAYADTHDEEHTRAVIQRLQALSSDATAEAASHIVEAWLFHQGDDISRASEELKRINPRALLPPFERYRLESIRGILVHSSGQHEAALAAYEHSLDLARAMNSAVREVDALTKLYVLYATSNNLDRCAEVLQQARQLAEQSHDELALVDLSTLDADLADRRDDRAGQGRALHEALARAKRNAITSDKIMWEVNSDLGGYYATVGDYAQSLSYSKRALELARKLQRKNYVQLGLYNVGTAEIGVGHLSAGKKLIETAIEEVLASGNLVKTDQMMRDYLPTLEQAGDLRGALDVLHRDDKIGEQIAKDSREKALLELSAKFDDERRARQIELLQRDNAIKSRDLQAQRLHQQMIAMAAFLITLTCGALAWGISRIRKVNARLLYISQHDALTGLHNRRYFNEHILTSLGNRPFLGCLLLINLDSFKRINDTLGHAAGNAVLAAVGKRLYAALPEGDSLIHLGAEEFVVISGPMSQAELTFMAQRLLEALRSEPVLCNGEAIRCSASIGGASFPLTGAAVDVSLDRAMTLVDNALARAKRRGRDRACLIIRVAAGSEQELISINTEFEEAAADARVQMVESAA